MYNSESIQLLLVLSLIIFLVIIFIRLALRIRKKGGSIATTMFAATYEFYNKDKKKAIEMMVEQKAHKKMEEQSSEDPLNSIRFNENRTNMKD